MMKPDSVSPGSARRTTRREMLRWAAGGATLVAGEGLWPLADATAASPQEALLRVGTTLDIKTLDPGRTLENQTSNINHVAYDTLVTFLGEDLSAVRPALATEWTVSRDGRTYTFKLRPNVRFARSGNVLTSADIKWSFDRVMNIKGAGAFLLNGVEAVKAPDPQTVVISLAEPLPALLPILTYPALSPLDSKVMAARGGDAGPTAREKDTAEAYLNANSVGTGAYVLISYTPKQEVVLVKNPAYWRGTPKFDRIVIRNILEASDRALMVERGDLHISVNLGRTEVDRLKNVRGVNVKSSLQINVVNVAMNNNPQIGGVFSNPKVHQAVRYALDYDGILALTDPGAVRAAGVIPTNLPGSRPTREAAKTDRERARQLLREANLGDVSGTFIFGVGLQGYGVDVGLLAQKIQQDLAAVGIKLALNALPYPVWIDLVRGGKVPIGIAGWNADYMAASNYLVWLPGRAVAGRRFGWLPESSPQAQETARLGHQAETEVNTAKRIALYQEVDRRIAEAGLFVPLYQPAVSIAYRSNLRGVTYTTGWYVDYGTISQT